jgi:hypothetical protein
MDRKTTICIWIIIIGLLNFLIFTVIYAHLGGEAINGQLVEYDGITHYQLTGGREVDAWVFWYSGLHSLSIWITMGAVMLAMLTLAKDRVIDAMHSTVVHGRTFLTILATVITTVVILITIWVSLKFARKLHNPVPGREAQTQSIVKR